MSEQTATPPTTTPARGLRKERVGQVVSTKMQKTAVVETTTRVPHRKFGKIVKQVKRFYAHDEEGKAQVGDTVRIAETRPLSKLKRWRLVEVVKH
ncbi:MAG: small subunit ribosomal protein [Chthoniobacter sp.]|jgi:small subunit ribosomal protein S17|nr:small subunit ribosomal protein [Chthoniobacter sp.]